MNLLSPVGDLTEPCPNCGRPIQFVIFGDPHPTEPATIVLRAEYDHQCPTRESMPEAA